MENKNELIKLISGMAIFSAVGATLYLLYSYCKRNKLPQWLEENIKSLEIKFKAEMGNKLLIQTICDLINVITELEEYFYDKEFSEFDSSRVNLLNTDKYEDAVTQTLHFKEICHIRAQEFLSKRLKISPSSINTLILDNKNKKELKEIMKTTKIIYPDYVLPKIEKGKLKQAYLYFADCTDKLNTIESGHVSLTQKRPEYKEISLNMFYLNKMILEDKIKKEFGIYTKFFTHLLERESLNEDQEISKASEKINFK